MAPEAFSRGRFGFASFRPTAHDACADGVLHCTRRPSSLQSIQQLIQAQDGRDSAFRDLQLSILKYLNDSGQLRVLADGTLELLPGMKLVPYQDLVSNDPKI